jgi:hypothetical protein
VAESKRVYDIHTLLKLSQSPSCFGLHSLRLSPEIPWGKSRWRVSYLDMDV